MPQPRLIMTNKTHRFSPHDANKSDGSTASPAPNQSVARAARTAARTAPQHSPLLALLLLRLRLSNGNRRPFLCLNFFL